MTLQYFLQMIGVLSLSILLIKAYSFGISYFKTKSLPKNEKDFEIEYLKKTNTLLQEKIKEQKKEIDQMIKLIYESQE